MRGIVFNEYCEERSKKMITKIIEAIQNIQEDIYKSMDGIKYYGEYLSMTTD